MKLYALGVLVSCPFIKLANKCQVDEHKKLPWLFIFLSWIGVIAGGILIIDYCSTQWGSFKKSADEKFFEFVRAKYESFSKSDLNKKMAKWFNE